MKRKNPSETLEPKAGIATSSSSRAFSKKLTVAAMAGTFALAAGGTWIGYDRTPELIAEVVVGMVAYLLIYMGVGHLDFRAVLGREFGGIVKSLFRRSKTPDVAVTPSEPGEV